MTEDERRRYRMLRGAYAYLASSEYLDTHANLFPLYESATSTSRGITFVYNSNGSILVNGTNNGTGASFSRANAFHLDPGEYKKSPALGNVMMYMQYRISATNWIPVDPSIAAKDFFTIDDRGNEYDIVARLYIRSGDSVDNILYEPWIYRVR